MPSGAMRLLREVAVYLWPRLPSPEPWKAWLVWLLRPKFIVGVNALVANDCGDILIGRHTYRTSRTWGPLGGAVSAGESLADALAREVREESSFEIAVDAITAVVQGTMPRRLDFVFRCHVVAGAFRPSSEVAEVRWVSPNELEQLLAPEDRWFAELASRSPNAPAEHHRRVR